MVSCTRHTHIAGRHMSSCLTVGLLFAETPMPGKRRVDGSLIRYAVKKRAQNVNIIFYAMAS